MKKSKNAQELLAERYGAKGTATREKFRVDAFAYYFGTIIKKRTVRKIWQRWLVKTLQE